MKLNHDTLYKTLRIDYGSAICKAFNLPITDEGKIEVLTSKGTVEVTPFKLADLISDMNSNNFEESFKKANSKMSKMNYESSMTELGNQICKMLNLPLTDNGNIEVMIIESTDIIEKTPPELAEFILQLSIELEFDKFRGTIHKIVTKQN